MVNIKDPRKDNYRSGSVTSSGQNVSPENFIPEENSQIPVKEIKVLHENAPCGYHSVDSEGTLVFMNETELNWLGYQREELIGKKRIFDIITRESQEIISRSLSSLIETGSVKNVRFQFVRKDGSFLPVLMNSVSSNDDLGNFAHCKSVVIDITELKRAEDSLKDRLYLLTRKKRHEEIFRAVTQSVNQSLDLQKVLENAVEAISSNIDKADSAGIYIVEEEEAVLRVHSGYTDRYLSKAARIPYPKGATWKTIIERTPTYIPDVDQDTIIGPTGREMGIKSHLSIPLHLQGKVVGCFSLSSFQKNTFDEDDLKLLGLIAQQIEIAFSNAQQAELLRQSEERYRTLFNQSPVGIYIFDNDYTIVKCNDRFVQILNSSYDRIIGVDIRKLKNQCVLPLMEKVLGGESATYDGFYEATGSEARLWVSIKLSPLRDAEGKVIGGMAVVEDITGRKLAEEELNNRNIDLEILNAVTLTVHRSLDLEEIYKVALNMVVRLECVDMTMIYLVNDQRNEAILQAQMNVPEDYIVRAERIPHPKGITWKVIESGEVYNVKDVQTDPNLGHAGRDLGHHSVLGIPIILEGNPIGVIWFLSYKEREFGEQEIDLLSSIGNQVAEAIAKAKLYDELSKKKRYQEIINIVTRSAHQSLDPQKVMENAVNAVSKNIVGAENVGIYLAEGQEAVLKAYQGFHQEFIDRIKRIPYPKGFIWRVILDEKTRYCPDVDQDDVIGPIGREAGTKSYVSIPILIEGKAMGALGLSSFSKNNAFSGEEIKLFENVVNQIELAIGNARKADDVRISEEKFRNLVEHTNDWVWEIDENGVFTYVSPQAYGITGYRTEEIIGNTTFDFMTSIEAERFLEVIEPLISGQRPFANVEKTIVHKDKFPIVMETSGSPIFDNEGVFRGYRGIARNVTDRIRKEQQLKMLDDINRAINQSLDLEEIYCIAMDRLIDLEFVDLVGLYIVDEKRNEAVMRAQRNFPHDYIRRAARIPYPKGVTWEVISTGEIINVKNARDESDVGPAGRDLGFRSMLVIPVAIEGETIGALWLLSYLEHEFTTPEEELLTSIGTQIGIAIAKANLFDQLSKKKRYEQIINAVTRSVHQSIDLDNVLENAVESMSKNITGAEIVSIFFVEGQEAVLKSYRGYPDWLIERLGRIPYPKGFTWKAIMEEKPIYCADVDEDTIIGPAGREVGTKSYASMPVRIDGKTIGTININSLHKNAFSDEELNLVEKVAHQIEIAINNARQAEALRESEERFRKLSESVRVIPWEADPATCRFTYIGPQAVEILGHPVEEWYKDGFWESHIHLDDRKWVLDFCHESTKKLDNYGFEYRMLDADSKVIWLHDIVTVVHEGGNPKLLRGMMFDITERKNAEEELQKAHDELEMRVLERTQRLSKTNTALRKEIRERKRMEEELRYSEDKYRTFYDHNPSMYFTVDKRGTVLSVNNFGAEQLGYTTEDLIGKSVLSVIHPEDQLGIDEQLRSCLKTLGQIYSWEFRKIRKDGSILWVRESARAVKSLHGNKVVLIVCEDITRRKLIEEQINKSLNEKEALLKEIHHRVKNNLQVISSLLNIQSRNLKGKKAQEIFDESQSRIKSMALIHEQLYKSRDLAKIGCGEYMQSLIEHLFQSYRVNPNYIEYRLNIKEISLDIDTAINCGLIINELVSNSLKHAFPADEGNAGQRKSKGEISIDLCLDNDGLTDPSRNTYTLIFSNNGLVFPEDLDFRNTETLGLQLVNTLVEQLEGTIELDRSIGTRFRITFNA